AAIACGADRATKIVFVDFPGPAMRILPGAPVRDTLIDHVSEGLFGDVRSKFARSFRRAVWPMPLLDVPERPAGKRDGLANFFGKVLRPRLCHSQPGSEGKHRQNKRHFV